MPIRARTPIGSELRAIKDDCASDYFFNGNLDFNGRQRKSGRKSIGLNARMTGMLVRANMSLVTAPLIPEKKRSRLRSNISEHSSDVTQTPLDSILNASTGRNLGKNFTIIKPNRSLSVHDSYDLPSQNLPSWRDVDGSGNSQAQEKQIPAWLSETFSTLQANNPLRALSRSASKQSPKQHENVLKGVIEPKNRHIFAFSCPPFSTVDEEEEEPIIILPEESVSEPQKIIMSDVMDEHPLQPYSTPGPFAQKSVHFLTPERYSSAPLEIPQLRHQSRTPSNEDRYINPTYNPYAIPGPASTFSLPQPPSWLSSPTAIDCTTNSRQKSSDFHSSPFGSVFAVTDDSVSSNMTTNENNKNSINNKGYKNSDSHMTNSHYSQVPTNFTKGSQDIVQSLLTDVLAPDDFSELLIEDSQTLSSPLLADDEIIEDEPAQKNVTADRFTMRYIAREHEAMIKLSDKDEDADRPILMLTNNSPRSKKVVTEKDATALEEEMPSKGSPSLNSVYPSLLQEKQTTSIPVELFSSPPYVRLSLEDMKHYPLETGGSPSHTKLAHQITPASQRINYTNCLATDRNLCSSPSSNLRLSRLPSPNIDGADTLVNRLAEDSIYLDACDPCTPPPRHIHPYHQSPNEYSKKPHKNNLRISTSNESQLLSPTYNNISKATSETTTKPTSSDLLINSELGLESTKGRRREAINSKEARTEVTDLEGTEKGEEEEKEERENLPHIRVVERSDTGDTQTRTRKFRPSFAPTPNSLFSPEWINPVVESLDVSTSVPSKRRSRANDEESGEGEDEGLRRQSTKKQKQERIFINGDGIDIDLHSTLSDDSIEDWDV